MTREPPLISVIIATLNAEKTLPVALRSLYRQEFPKDKLEILVIDGGSTDSTIAIAKRFHCRILKNPDVEPARAKYLGYIKARGKYLMYLDSDEEMVSDKSLRRKLDVFLSEKNVRAVTGSGYRSPPSFAFINRYVNEFGDPFSFFIYHLSKDERFFLPTMRTRYVPKRETPSYVVFDFSAAETLPIFELVAMGSMVDRDYLLKKFPKISKNPGVIAHLFYLLVSRGADIGIVKNDALMHYSVSLLKGYLAKIRSRVKSNVFTQAEEGFRGRARLSQIAMYRPYLFLPYALTAIGPIVDSIVLSASRKNWGYLVHVPLSLYTAFTILYYMAARSLGYHPKQTAYGI